jgi:hypothetical protein
MDKWNPDQMEKMRQGGNDKFKEFIRAYGPEGGWDDKASIAEKYKTWAAAQYREKVSPGIRSRSLRGGGAQREISIRPALTAKHGNCRWNIHQILSTRIFQQETYPQSIDYAEPIFILEQPFPDFFTLFKRRAGGTGREGRAEES